MNKLIYVSIMFDPCEKTEAMDFVFEDFLGKVEGTALFFSAEKEMFALVNEYKKRLQPIDESISTSQSTSNLNETNDVRKLRHLLRDKYKKNNIGWSGWC